MTPDRHLGSAWIDKCRPDILISESTYATTIRDSKRCRERDFLKKVHDTIDKGGKVNQSIKSSIIDYTLDKNEEGFTGAEIQTLRKTCYYVNITNGYRGKTKLCVDLYSFNLKAQPGGGQRALLRH